MSPIVAPSAAAKQAEQLKQDGNNYFQKNRFAAAIDAYTEAITLCPNVPIYWTNRALCYRKRDEWTRVEEDCREAILLDHTSVKAHYMLGLALLQKEQYAEGVRELAKVRTLVSLNIYFPNLCMDPNFFATVAYSSSCSMFSSGPVMYYIAIMHYLLYVRCIS
ncbi:PREDICTED: E3 ubiquitin-protein ligase CHIP-like [Nicotiana attenuata]|uniref:RING-type E3 ubiquitin transferase n=1 Tax=Nicotiana attenuata TaxID=49451 RepID=A0A1J6I3W7_NICAT|nr:PREDICTED: E3 ubiquitin-protein ligase CHIP-like [Nicotiana attenuata]OIS99708.1 e3 ubiquitin-protein ligase chip [Nicotiana attenuata]